MSLILGTDPGNEQSAWCVGTQFGFLTVLSAAGKHVTPNGTSIRRVLCQCQCGNQKVVRLPELTRTDGKRTVSCGCHRLAANRARTPPSSRIHGLSTRATTHYLYSTWKGIKARCYRVTDENYELYGARGIRMCQEWVNDPAAFVEYVLRTLGERPASMTLDRRENNGNYEPGNLRWATKSEQVHNRRPTSEWRTKPGRRKK